MCCYILPVNSYRMLGIFPHPGRSHVDVFVPIMEALALKGHHVTVVSHFPRLKHIQRYTDIRLNQSMFHWVDSMDMNDIPSDRQQLYQTPIMLALMAEATCDYSLNTPKLEALVKLGPVFDVVIYETFNSDCFLSVAQNFKAPLIGLSSSTMLSWYSERFGQPNNPSYIPNNLMDYSDKLKFLERLENFLVNIYQKLVFKFLIGRTDSRLAKAYFGATLSPLQEVAFNTSLLLVNTHFSLSLPRPNVPAVIEIGGVHIGKNKKLPEVSHGCKCVTTLRKLVGIFFRLK